MKPMIPDFCPACGAVPENGFPVISEIRELEYRGRGAEIQCLAYQCECGFRMFGPGQLQDLIEKTNEKLSLENRQT